MERSALGCCYPGRAMMGPAKEAQPHQSEQEADQEQEQEDMKGHRDPRGLNDVAWTMIKEE